MERKLHIWSWILVGALLLPLFQQVTGLVHTRKLKGAVKIAEVPEFSKDDWFSVAYQPAAEKALNDRFGFRAVFVRVNNQLAFTLYRKALASGVVIGKKNYLYESNYIKAYYGTDFLGDSVISEKVRKLKVIQDSLAEKGTKLLLAFAAGKGSYYPDFFPDRYHTEKGPTNIETYVKFCQEAGLNYIDFNSWFLEMKDTSRYCLYPRTGVHWSYYGMVLVVDSLIRYTEELTGKDMPEFEWGNIKVSRKYRSSDRDIEDGMNILFRVNYDKLAYPEIHYPEDESDSVKSIVIADSFYWGLHNLGISNRAFHEGEFWYYYNRIMANHLEEAILVEEIDVLPKLIESDVIILMATEATMDRFPFGFIEDVYALIQE